MPASSKLKGRYELKEILAKGGMGVVYRAVDGVMKRQVAVKTLLDLTDATGLQLFRKECEVLASMTHPNIIEIYDVGEFEEEGVARPYLVMPLLPGVTLDKLIRNSSQRLTVERSIDIACQACRGLQAAHEKGMVHRDIKPSNIFVLEDDSIKIIDFGVAHNAEASRTAGRKGTLLYMSPEQIEMKPVSAASDLFSLGVVCYEMLTRRRPFERTTESSVADAILHFIPVPASDLNPTVSRVVSQAVHKAMAKQPWNRYSSARELADTLQKALRNEPIDLFNTARMRPRLARAMQTLERGDYQYASEIIGELEGEGHLEPDISELRRKIDEAIRRRTIGQLLDTARSRIETEEYPLALQKIYEVLHLDPTHGEALSLKVEVENKRTERDVEEWFRLTGQHLERFDFGHARGALQHILQLRPKETRALQMLSEVNRIEQEHSRARQDKEQLYQAAVAANQRGDVSSALSKLERVLDLDRRVPDAADPERSTNYQNLYNKVRSEHENSQRAYAEAKHQLEAGNFPAALALCAEQLAKYPENALFQALKIDVEERQRQALSARIAEIDQKVDAEPDLDRRITIIEDAVRAIPGERHFEQLLQRTREKRNLIESIVIRARMHEQQAQFGEALSQWEILKTIYHRYPGLSMEIDRIVRRRDQHLRAEGRNRWVEQIDQTLEGRDYDRALRLLATAQAEYQADSELAQLEKLAKQGLERVAEAQRLVAQGQDECAAGRYEEGVALLERACALDDRNSGARAALRNIRVERARGLVDSDSMAAEQLLRQALQLDPEDAGAKSLVSLIEDRRRQEAVDRCVSEARQFQSQGDLQTAARLAEHGLRSFPREPRLVQLQSSVNKGLEELRRRELDQANGIDRDAATVFERPTQSASPDQTPTQLLSYIAEPFTEAAMVREEVVRPPVQLQEPAPASVAPVRGQSAWQRFRSMVEGRRTVRIAGAIAGVAILVLAAAVVLIPRSKPPMVMPDEGTLEVITSPPGATVLVNGKAKGSAVPRLQVATAAGSVEVEARMPGFQTGKSTARLEKGKRLTVNLTLLPIVSLKLFVPLDSRVGINNEEPVRVQDGQFLRDFPVGTYSVKLFAVKGTLAFAFEVRPDGPAVVTGLPVAQEISALLINNFGDQARIFIGSSPVDVKLDGQPLGKVDRNGLDLPKLAPASHALELGAEKDPRKQLIEIGPERTLTAIILGSDPNTGTLLVQSNEDQVTIGIFVNGTEVRRGNSQKGTFRATLRAGKYSVRAAKEGYETDAGEQQVDLQKGEDRKISFVFRPLPAAASAMIRLTPGSELFVDGTSKGIIQEENRTIDDLKPISHTFRADKGKRYQTIERTAVFRAGQTTDVDLRLTPAPVPVEIRKAPTDSTVTYIQTGDSAVRTFIGTRQELAEGEYTFTAKANGYLQKIATERVSWDFLRVIDLRLENARESFTLTSWDKGAWTARGGYFERTRGGFVIFPKPLSYVQFSIRMPAGKPRALWFVHYVNERNHIRCEIDDDGFRATRISEAMSEVVSRKNGTPKQEWYTIRMSASADGASFLLQTSASEWGPLGSVSEPGFFETRFGFFVPNGQQIHLTNFEAQGVK